MCIICIKPKNKELPSKEIIQTMFENNPHGGGFCYAEQGQVVIRKGFMDFDSFYKALNEIPKVKNKNVVIHTRITTHGSTSQENCHPFPLSNRIEDLKATSIETNVGIIHNGIIRSVEADKANDLSDTMTYIKDVLYLKYMQDRGFMNKKRVREEIQKEIASKMVIMKSDGSYHIIGEFNTDENGYIYSNFSYIPYDYESYYSTKEEECYTSQGEDFVLLKENDFIMVDGQKVFGDEMELFLTDDGVYVEDFDSLTGFEKVANYAFNEKGSIIRYMDRLLDDVRWECM